jgi:hypothetical protein
MSIDICAFPALGADHLHLEAQAVLAEPLRRGGQRGGRVGLVSGGRCARARLRLLAGRAAAGEPEHGDQGEAGDRQSSIRHGFPPRSARPVLPGAGPQFGAHGSEEVRHPGSRRRGRGAYGH